jgi:hypothetical protein
MYAKWLVVVGRVRVKVRVRGPPKALSALARGSLGGRLPVILIHSNSLKLLPPTFSPKGKLSTKRSSFTSSASRIKSPTKAACRSSHGTSLFISFDPPLDDDDDDDGDIKDDKIQEDDEGENATISWITFLGI